MEEEADEGTGEDEAGQGEEQEEQDEQEEEEEEEEEGAGGQLGHGDQQNQLLPKKIEAFAGQRVVAVSTGVGHSLALTADGAVFIWGEAEGGHTDV